MNHNIFWKIIKRLPRSWTAYSIARIYMAHYLGDGIGDFRYTGELRVMQQTQPKDDVFVAFDVGANVGDWTQSVLSYHPTAKVHSFEPNPKPAAVFHARGFTPQVTLNTFGMGDTRETRSFHLYENDELSTLYAGYTIPPDDVTTVQIETIDDYCHDHNIDWIDYLKIDTEGHDVAVIKGAKRMLSEGRIGTVQFEYGRHWILSRTFLRDVFEFVQEFDLPYDIFKVMPDHLKPLSQYRLTFDEFRLAYFVLRLREEEGQANLPLP